MNYNVDLIIFSTFLIFNLLVGLFYSRGVTSIGDYAIGRRNFSTGTIVATLVATWIGAGFFSSTLVETYRNGLYFLIPSLGNSLVFLIIGYFLTPRMGEFLGKLSIAEAMNELFGKRVKLITVVSGILASIGVLGVQFKVSAKLLELIFGTSGSFATVLSAMIVIVYSAFGGIRAVTFTDIIQFFTFGCVIPIVATIIWGAISDHSKISDTLMFNSAFNLSEVFDLYNPEFYKMLSLLVFFLFPCFSPMLFQRVSMCNSVQQASRAFKIAGFLCLIIQLVIAAIAVFTLSDNPDVNPDNLVSYIINHYSYTGFKGIVAVGIMAMIMSTSDSLINAMSVIFAHDLCKPMGFKWSNNELLVSKIFAVFSGVFAIFFALKVDSILNLMRMAWSFYTPIVAAPFFIAILGFRTSEKPVLIGMIASIITVGFWIAYVHSAFDAYIPGIFVNFLFLFSSHYLLNQPGGWVGIKNPIIFQDYKEQKRRERQDLINSILNFNFLEFCQNNMPLNRSIFSYFGFFAMVSIFLGMYSVPQSIYSNYREIINVIFFSVMVISCYFLTYPIWPSVFQNERFLSIVWILGALYISVISSTIFAVINALAPIQLMILFSNLMIISIVFRWQIVLFMVISGVFLTILFLKTWIGLEIIDIGLVAVEFKILYCFLLFSCVLIAFLKPLQQDTDRKIKLFKEAEKRIAEMSEQILNLMIMKQEFVNNINHEIRNPLHHIGSSVYLLHNDWEVMSEDDKKDNVNAVYQGYKKIVEYIENILDLSDLSTNKIKLNYKSVNLASLVQKILDEYRKFYVDNPDLFTIYLSVNTENVTVLCDDEKIIQAIKYLVQNAIDYSKHGKIEVSLSDYEFDLIDKKNIKGIRVSVSDEGVGIPEKELSYIFGPFIQSSYTKTRYGGRGLGLGLAIAEKLVQVHNGMIWAKNNENKKGATFSFVLPLV